MGRETVDTLAGRQLGLISFEQLRRLGMSESTICGWLKRERLHVVHDGVFRTSGAPVTFRQRCLAATIAGGPDCFLSHRAAAALWELRDEAEIDVVVVRTRLPRLQGVSVHRSRDLDRFRMTRRHGVPVTPPALTILDLGAVVPWWDVREAMEQAFVKQLIRPPALEAAYTIVARPGRRGAGVVRRLLDNRALGTQMPDSKVESTMARLCFRYALPKPVFHYRVVDAKGRFVAEPDFAYPDQMIVIEIDSLSHHGTADALQADLTRQNELVHLGYTVLRFTWHDVKFRPRYVATTISSCLGA